jgi:hypothetical protein
MIYGNAAQCKGTEYDAGSLTSSYSTRLASRILLMRSWSAFTFGIAVMEVVYRMILLHVLMTATASRGSLATAMGQQTLRASSVTQIGGSSGDSINTRCLARSLPSTTDTTLIGSELWLDNKAFKLSPEANKQHTRTPHQLRYP